jgi:hypothetical protein
MKQVALLAICFKLVSCLAYSSTLKMKAACSSERSVDFKLTTRRYVQDLFSYLFNAEDGNNTPYIHPKSWYYFHP